MRRRRSSLRTVDFLEEVKKVEKVETEFIRAGKIYRKTAEMVLETEFPEVSIEQRERLIEAADYKRLEAMTNVGDYFKVAIEALRTELDGLGIYLPSAMEEIVLYSETPDRDMANASFYYFNYYSGEKAEIILEIIRAVHNYWVSQSTVKFFNESKTEEFYRFMPIELVGIERVKYFYSAFVEPVVSLLGLTVGSSCLERAYETMQEYYLLQEGILDEDTLCDALARMDYYALAPSIENILESDGGIVADIAAQIRRYNPVLC